ncbi:MAG: hypothetical protein WA463_06605 [Terriglobales bacterium]
MKTLLSSLVLAIPLTVLAQDIDNGFVVQAEAPVQWRSMSAGGSGGDVAYGILRNFGKKDVVALQAGWITFFGCDTGDDVTIGPVVKMGIPAGKEKEIGLKALAADIRARMKSRGSQTATILVGLVHIDFADGSTWDFDLNSDPSFENNPEYVLTRKRVCPPETSATSTLSTFRLTSIGMSDW